MHLHQYVADMAAHEPAERRREVEPVQADHVDEEDVERVRQHARDPAVQEPHQPLTRTALVSRGRLERAQRQCRGRAEDEEDRREHGQRHVLEHVQADGDLRVDRDAGVGAPQQDGDAGQPRHRAHHGPGVSPPDQANHAGHIQRSGDEAEREEQGVQAETEGDVREIGCWRVREAQQALAVGGVLDLDPRRRARRQRDPEADGDRHDEELEPRDAGEHGRARRPAERADDPLAHDPAEDGQDEDQCGLRQDDLSVAGREQLTGVVEPGVGVREPAGSHQDDRDERHRREPMDRSLQREVASCRVHSQREQPADPHEGSHRVGDARRHGQRVVAEAGAVARQSRQGRCHECHGEPGDRGPRRRRDGGTEADDDRQHRHHQERPSRGHLVRVGRDDVRSDGLRDRHAQDQRQLPEHRQQREHRPGGRCHRGVAQVRASLPGYDALPTGRVEEGRRQQPADRGDRGEVGERAQDGGSPPDQRPGVGQPGQRRLVRPAGDDEPDGRRDERQHDQRKAGGREGSPAYRAARCRRAGGSRRHGHGHIVPDGPAPGRPAGPGCRVVTCRLPHRGDAGRTRSRSRSRRPGRG